MGWFVLWDAREAQAAGRMVLAAGRRWFTQFGLRHWREASVASLPGRGSKLGDASGLEDLDLVEHANLLSVLQVETIIGRTRSKAGATLSRPPSAALFLDRGSAHQIPHDFRDILRAVTDPFDRTGHEQHLCVRRNPTWILEHVCEELAKEGSVHRIELGIARPDLLRLQGVSLRVGVHRVIHHLHRETAEIDE